MNNNWIRKKIEEVCNVNYGTRVVRKKDGGTIYPVYGGGGKTFFLDKYNREDCMIIARFAMSEECTRYVKGKFFLNDSGLTVSPKNSSAITQDFLNLQLYFLNDYIYSLARGAAQKNLDVPAFRNIVICYPESILEQNRIVNITNNIINNIAQVKDIAEKNLQNTRELFESHILHIFNKSENTWERKKLGDKDLFQIIDGDRGKNYPKKSDFLDEGYCLFLNTKNVRPDGFDFQKTMFISENKDKALGTGKLQRNDVLLTTRGTIGNIAVYDENVPYEKIRINSGMLIFRPNVNLVAPEYLFRIFQSGIMKNQIKKFVSGAAQPQLPIKTLVNFTIPVPKSLSEQKSIVNKIDTLSTNTKKLETIYIQKISDLEELKKSILHKAFQGELHA